MNEFVGAAANMKLYPNNHPQVLYRIDCLFEILLSVFEKVPELTLFILDDDIIAFDKPVPDTGLVGESFIKILSSKGIERITLLKNLPKLELYHFIIELAASDKKSIAATSHIKLGKVIIDGAPEQNIVPPDETAELIAFKNKAVQELKKIYLEIQGNSIPNTAKAKKIVRDFIKIYDKSISPLNILTPVKYDDDYTYVHITNVALLTICFADYLGFSGKNLEEIGIAALLHDVGKMFIPDGILSKPGPLTVHERTEMEKHTLKGAQYIGQQESIPKLTMISALEHHIKYDGSGYPSISKNWQTNIVSQMISVTDVYDALRSKRPYQEAMEYDKIVAILKAGRGSDFNPVLIENFLNMIEK